MVSLSRTPRPGAARNFFNEQLKEYNEDFDIRHWDRGWVGDVTDGLETRSLRASPLTSSGFGDR